jgi:pullulanase
MHSINRIQIAAFPVALVAVLLLNSSVQGVQVDFATGGIQLKEGCTGDMAEFCDLRIYQVMVESFVDGDASVNYNDGYGTSHHRGDLRGIIQSLDYIKNLGMNAIWMTPLFDSHAGAPQDRLTGFDPVNLKLDATGYYTRDYFNIDPKFGTLDDARELVDTAHQKGIYVLFDGVFGHHKGALETSPTGKLPVDSTDWADYNGNPQNYPGRVVDYGAQASIDFYQEVATYWIDELGIDGWRLDQGYQVPLAAWQEIKGAVETTSAERALAGETWGTLGYLVSENWGGAEWITDTAYGTDADPALNSAFDFPVRYATVGVLAGEESGWSGRPASTLGDSWSYGAHDQTYPAHALPNLMLGNHDLVRLGDLLQRVDLADPADAEYWTRHRLAFMVQGAYSGPITRYYGEEIGDEVPNYADQVTDNCANLGLCDDHVARTSAKILDVTVTSEQLSAEQHALMQFHHELMELRTQYAALSHGTRQHLYSDNDLYIDLKTHDQQEIVFAMNVSDQAISVQLSENLFTSMPPNAWDLLNEIPVDFVSGYLTFTLQPLSGQYILLADGPDSIAGDFDGDGDVDGSDFLAWQRGESNPPLSSTDFADWEANFGLETTPLATVSATVPEPASFTLIVFTVVGAFTLRVKLK